MSREMKDSGIEWVGKIPKDWTTIKLKDIALGKDGLFLDGDWIESDIISDSGIRYLTTGNIGNGFFKEQGNGYVTEDIVKSMNCLIAKPNDIVISRLNKPIARACILPSTHDKYIIAVDNVVLRPGDDKSDKDYLIYAMNIDGYNEAANMISRGATMPRISRTMLGSIKTLYPQFSEQKKISQFLKPITNQLDSNIEKIKSTIEDYKLLKQSIITEAVTKGLDKNVKLKDTGIEWIGKVPKNWDVMKLKHTVKVREEKNNFDSSKDCFIGLENISSQSGKYIITDTKYENSLCPVFMKGDVLFGKLRPYLAKCLWVDFSGYCTNELLIIKDFIGHKRYLQLYLLSPLFIDQVNSSTYGTKMPRANWNFIKELEIPLPPVEEQNRIVEFFDDKINKIDTLLEQKEALLIDIELYKKSLIYEYVTGKKRLSKRKEAPDWNIKK